MGCKTQDTSGNKFAIGQLAPSFDLPGVDGHQHTLEKYRGKVKALVVIFSCNHCPWVIKYENRMIALGKEYRNSGVGFVIINVNDVGQYPADSFDNMKKRSTDKGYPFPYLYDESQDSAHAYGAQVTPEIFLFDGELKLSYTGSIDDNPDNAKRPTQQYLKDAIEAILAGQPDRIIEPRTQPRGCSIKWK
ncbi:MAG: thioredoxin family protein [Candidatus Electryoneaceae bacterium]|nr:thioredoxin family protein [Candidatus Electryoneaceae bacterium]